MRRGVIIGFVALGALAVILMVTVAWNGSQLDGARQQRDDLQFEADDLRQEVESLTTERDDLQKKLDDDLKAIEQLKAQGAVSAVSNQAPTAPSTAATP